MHKPRNYLVVNGVDLFDEFGLVMTDEYELRPPAPKYYLVDIPGGDGAIDATEAISGDVSYENRAQSFDMLVCYPRDFEATKTAVSNFLHGRALSWKVSFDPEYTYTGRMEVDEYYSRMHHGVIRIVASADPYKSKGKVTVRVPAGGGRGATVVCGRKRQCPTVECSTEVSVQLNGANVTLQPGSWRHPDLWLKPGVNEVFCSASGSRGVGIIDDYDEFLCGDVSTSRISDLMWPDKPSDDETEAVYLTYEIKDL